MQRKKIVGVVGILALFMFSAFSPAHSETRELRVVGSWNSLTMYKNFEMPFWTEVVPAATRPENQHDISQPITLKGPAVLRPNEHGPCLRSPYGPSITVVDDSPALAGLDLPALATDIADARKVVEAYRPVLEEYLAKDFDAKLLSVAPYLHRSFSAEIA